MTEELAKDDKEVFTNLTQGLVKDAYFTVSDNYKFNSRLNRNLAVALALATATGMWAQSVLAGTDVSDMPEEVERQLVALTTEIGRFVDNDKL